MSDITKHEFSSNSILGIYDVEGDLEFDLSSRVFWINELDAIATANHFYSQLETPEDKNKFLDNITSKRDK